MPLFGLVSCRSFYKRFEIFRAFLSSTKIEHRSKYMKKLVLTLLVLVWAPNRAATTQSSNRLRRFLSHGPFSWSKKRDFLNIYNDNLLSIASDLFLSLFLPKQAISSAGAFTFSTSSCHVLLETRSTAFLTKCEKNNMIRWETVHSKTGFSSNDRKLSKAVRGLKRILWCTRRVTLISGWGELFSK